MCAQRRLLSDCAYAQSDKSLRWAHMQYCRKCCVSAHFIITPNKNWKYGSPIPNAAKQIEVIVIITDELVVAMT